MLESNKCVPLSFTSVNPCESILHVFFWFNQICGMDECVITQRNARESQKTREGVGRSKIIGIGVTEKNITTDYFRVLSWYVISYLFIPEKDFVLLF